MDECVCVCVCVCVCAVVLIRGRPECVLRLAVIWSTVAASRIMSVLPRKWAVQGLRDGDDNLCVFVEPASENSKGDFWYKCVGRVPEGEEDTERSESGRRESVRERKRYGTAHPLPKSARYWLAGIGAVNTTNNSPDTQEWERPDQTRWKTAMLHKRFFFTLQIDY